VTSVAVVEGGQPFAAANVAPALGDAYVAGSEGTTRNGEPVSVTDHREPRFANVAATFIPGFGSRVDYAAGVAELFERFGNVRRYGSAQLTLSHMACGVLDGAVAPSRADPWDCIAGTYLVAHAGGRVTDLDGEPWRHDSRGLVASNGRVHDELLEAAARMAGD
jgi:myo-inositol-1(or 4)-monophosphatase